jgi:hypothetical protein
MLPSTVKAGPIWYDIQLDEGLREKELYGSIRFLESVIALLPGLPLVLEKIKLLHELIHAVLANAGFAKHDERVVDALAFGLLQIWLENPELVKYLCSVED